jgi:chemotaxis protein methyltransferase CheR
MDAPSVNAFIRIDDESFERLSSFVTREYGIKLPPVKKSMLESRLNKKVKSLGMNSYSEFLDFLFSDQGKQSELFNVIDLITTNKTDFFREPAHFSYLAGEFLKDYISERNNLKIWSAGCSTGEEPYTLIMVLEEFKKQNPILTYSLLASDISLRVIQSAFNGIYTMDRLAAIPMEMKRNYFLRSKTNPNLARVKQQFRKKIQYKRINLMDKSFGLVKSDYDVIFCRNVLIYFDKPTQEEVIKKFCSHLRPGGLLFLGHSESIMGMNLPLTQVRPTVYQLKE